MVENHPFFEGEPFYPMLSPDYLKAQLEQYEKLVAETEDPHISQRHRLFVERARAEYLASLLIN